MIRNIKRVVRIGAALATDKRLPAWMRWAVRISLAIKVVPVPDLGIDEILLGIVAISLVTIHRSTLRAILAESAA